VSKTIAFIPARGGSKAIPDKNVKEINGQPLILWVIQELLDCGDIAEIVVSTDSDLIEDCVKRIKDSRLNVYHRSTENASDTASTDSALIEFLEERKLAKEIIILVQATSPFTKSEHFEEGLSLMTKGFDSVLSVVESTRFFWQEGKAINYDILSRPRRQDFDGFLMENGAFYISKADQIISTNNRISGNVGTLTMPAYTGLELDEESDWVQGEALLKYYGFSPRYTFWKKIKLVASDVDGVLTDARMYYSENGDELKKFNARDGMGFELLRSVGIKTAIITSEQTDIVLRRGKKLQIDHIYQGKDSGDKLESLKEICKIEHIELSEVAYIGDDINCKEVLKHVGWAACPSDAVKAVKSIRGITILKSKGGDGVVREFIESILIQGKAN